MEGTRLSSHGSTKGRHPAREVSGKHVIFLETWSLVIQPNLDGSKTSAMDSVFRELGMRGQTEKNKTKTGGRTGSMAGDTVSLEG